MINIVQENDIYKIHFKYNPNIIARIKNVPGKKWDSVNKYWTIPKAHLGWLLTEFKDTPYENQIEIVSDEQLNENAVIGTTATAEIPDIDISDITHYVMSGGKLYQHQLDFLKYAKSRIGKGFILCDEMGCVAADTIVGVKFGKSSYRKITIKALYNKLTNKSGRCDTNIQYNVKCYKDDLNIIDYSPIQSVKYSGCKPVFKISTDSGRCLKATTDHPILTPMGYVEVQNLTVGDTVMIANYGVKVGHSRITDIIYVGTEDTYDIIMTDPYRNFVADGIVVHNCGKTLEVMNYAKYVQRKCEYKHCLILCCVNSAKYSWQEDIRKHTNGLEEAYILGTRRKKRGGFRYSTSGADKLKDLQLNRMYGDKDAPELPYFIILNIESLRTRHGKKYTIADEIVSMINLGEINIIALDEAHKNISPKATQGKIILDMKKKTGTRAEWIPMTGTPIVNKPTDVYTPLKLVDGHSIRSYYEWENLFCIKGGYGSYDIVGYKNIPKLKEMLQNNMLRRLKSEVLDLPPKIYYTEYVENSDVQQKLYLDVQMDLLSKKDEIMSSLNPLAKMLRLRQCTGSPELIDDSINVKSSDYPKINAKLSRLLEIVEEIISRDEKVVIFSNWVQHLKPVYTHLKSRFRKVACFTGSMSEADRQKHKNAFINDPEVKILIGTIGALGTNHTLTVANNVIFYDEPWVSADKVQAEDRTHRAGTTQSVNIYTLIAKDTIDETVHKILYDKQGMSDFIVDNRLDIKTNPELFDLLLGSENLK